jgi:gamma-glutamyltranspeptidase/glutathione hydrolase
VDEDWEYMFEYEKEILQRSEYGLRTFYPGGNALQLGDTLRQPELAQFLINVAEQGADYMYTGGWAQECVDLVRQEGGLMTMEDMAAYQPTWTEPWRMSYRGYDLCATSGRSMYALKTLLALKTLEHTTINQLGHFSASADALEILVRIVRAVDEEGWIYDYNFLDNRDLVQSRLTLDYTDRIWAKVQSGISGTSYFLPPPVPHTLTLVVADTDGNVLSGKHSINSWYFGQGLFVQGIPLSATCEQTYRYTGPGQRRTQGAPNVLVFKDGPLRFSVGSIGGSNPITAFQFLVSLMDYGLPANETAQAPRFGGFAYNDDTGQYEYDKNQLEQSVSQEIVNILAGRGLYFIKQRRVGSAAAVQFNADGTAVVGIR